MNKRRIALFIVILLLIIGGIFAFLQFSKKSPPSVTAGKVTISVKCDNILDNLDKVKDSVKQLVPEDGIILNDTVVEITSGESALDLLMRVLKENKTHIETEGNNAFGTKYIKGIANIYEFDVGGSSGWKYIHNSKFAGVSIEMTKLKDGDVIQLVYTVNGNDDVEKYIHNK